MALLCEWGTSIKPKMQVVIDKLISLSGKLIETLIAAEARMQPTPSDAEIAVMNDSNMPMPPCTMRYDGQRYFGY